MNDEIHRHLDGEIPAESLDPDLRKEAEDWDRMVASFRRAAPHGEAPPWLEQRVMAQIEALPGRGWLGRLASWLVSPEPVRISPLAAGLVTGAIVLALMLPGRDATPAPDEPPTAAGPVETVVYVQFVLEAPGASSVSVAGDFSDWQPDFTLEDPDGDGVWSGRVPVQPGVHGYMFLIDGTEWLTDPNASRYQDDGFGNRNAVLAVGATS